MFQLTNHYICNRMRVLDTGFRFRFIRQTNSEHGHLLICTKATRVRQELPTRAVQKSQDYAFLDLEVNLHNTYLDSKFDKSCIVCTKV